uniref:Ig-like domain-containing protein n=1 Tax=Esox lucius TaxID=8010 RepID=A0A3P8XJV4_ESOLU
MALRSTPLCSDGFVCVGKLKPVVTLKPNSPIFRGETVTIRCIIEGGDSDWEYDFIKNGQSVYSDTKLEYRISPVYTSHSGEYRCIRKHRKVQNDSEWKSVLSTHLILDQSKAVLSISPQWMNPGDSVTLICEVKESSTGWRFSWYKTPLSGNETTKEFDFVFLCSVLHSSMSVRISPNRTQHFTSKSLSLTCDLKGNSTGWRLMRYTETGVESGCSPNWGSITGSTCTITSTDTEDSGVYWCESGSGQYSNAVNITVSGGDVILESPVHPVTEGDSLTLLCTHRNQPHTNTKADFYKDGVLISNDSIQEMTIPTVSKSDEGFYKCKSDQIESPESWVTLIMITHNLLMIYKCIN